MIYLQHSNLFFESKEMCLLSAAYESVHNSQFHCGIKVQFGYYFVSATYFILEQLDTWLDSLTINVVMYFWMGEWHLFEGLIFET